MRIAWNIYHWATLAFLVLLPLQFAIAGYGVFSDDYGAHEAYGAGLLHLVSLIMLLAALGARMWKTAGWAFLMFMVFFVQIFLVEIGRDNDMLWVSGLHPFIAFCYWPFTYFVLWPAKLEANAGADTPAT